MTTNVRNWFDLADLVHTYKRRVPVILVNGLAEQSESWFANRDGPFTGLRAEGSRDPGLRRRRNPPADRVRRRDLRRIPGRSALPVPGRVCAAISLRPGRLEPGLPGRLDRRRAAPRKRFQAGADLPFRLARQREPADDRRRAPQRHGQPGPLRLSPQPVRQRGAGRRRAQRSCRIDDGKRAFCEPCGARSAIRWLRSCRWFRRVFS